MISIIVPFHDKVDLLQKCVASILSVSIYRDFELLLVDNASEKSETLEYLAKIENTNNIRVLRYSQPFNFSAINNFAAKEAKGEYLLFLNNDTEVISENWLEALLKQFDDLEVGVVGAKLLYPNGTIQHAGVEIRNGDLAHVYGKQQDSSDPLAEFNQKRECLAVTAACMLTKKGLFEELGGFDETNLAIAYNDVDYCLKVHEKGLKVIYIPEAKLYHYESATRGRDIWKRFLHPKRYKEFLKERDFLRKKWPNYFNQ